MFNEFKFDYVNLAEFINSAEIINSNPNKKTG